MPQIRRMAYFLVVMLGIALGAAHAWNPAHPPAFKGISTGDVPQDIDGYHSTGDYELSEEVKMALSSSTAISRTYTNGQDNIDFILIAGNDRQALHDPRSCLIGDGWSLADQRSELLPTTQIDVRTCRAIGKAGTRGTDIIYFYVVDGQIINEPTQIRNRMLWSGIIGRKNTPAYYFRFSHALDSNDNATPEEHTKLEQFAAKTWVDMQPKLVKTQTTHPS